MGKSLIITHKVACPSCATRQSMSISRSEAKAKIGIYLNATCSSCKKNFHIRINKNYSFSPFADKR